MKKPFRYVISNIAYMAAASLVTCACSVEKENIETDEEHEIITVPCNSHTYNVSINERMELICLELLKIENLESGCNEFVRAPYKVSKKGQEFIKAHEGLRLKAYRINKERLLTIGYGHQILKGEANEIGKTITIEKAEALFQSDMKRFNESVNRLVGGLDKRFKCTQGFIDALGSLCYNCGESGVENSEFYKRLKRCRFDEDGEIIKEDLEWSLKGIKTSNVVIKQLKKRRLDEYELASSGK